MTYNEFQQRLDDLLTLRDRLTCRQIDAGACQTSTDFRRKHEAEIAYENAKAKLEEQITKEGVSRG